MIDELLGLIGTAPFVLCAAQLVACKQTPSGGSNHRGEPPAATIAPSTSRTSAPLAALARASQSKTQPRMVRIPSGRLHFASSGARSARSVGLPSFEMDVTEVTVAEYQACVDAKACQPAFSTMSLQGVTLRDAHTANRACNVGHKERQRYPINCVDWYQARDYCRWADKRLPTEEEWEYAARGAKEQTLRDEHPRLPGGCSSEWVDVLKLNPAKHPRRWIPMYQDNSSGRPGEVGSSPEAQSPFGVLDQAGGVWEWTESKYCDLDDGKRTCEEARVVRGACWHHVEPSALARLPLRFRIVPSDRGSGLGFRCVRSLRSSTSGAKRAAGAVLPR